MNPLTIGYFADGPWSHRALEKLILDPTIRIAFICARHDRPDPVLKEQAEIQRIEFLTHPRINSDEFLEKIGRHGCDLFVSMSFNQIFGRRLIEHPRLQTINCHAGKLPFYRGRNVLNWALINDERSSASPFTLSMKASTRATSWLTHPPHHRPRRLRNAPGARLSRVCRAAVRNYQAVAGGPGRSCGAKREAPAGLLLHGKGGRRRTSELESALPRRFQFCPCDLPSRSGSADFPRGCGDQDQSSRADAGGPGIQGDTRSGCRSRTGGAFS